MKKFILTSIFAAFSVLSFAQSDFDKKITDKVIKIEKAKTSGEFAALHNEFASLTLAKSDNIWKAYYYAGLAKYKEVETILKTGKFVGLDESNAIAYKYAMSAFYTQQQNTEIQNLVKLIEAQKKKITDGNTFTKR